MNLLAVHILAMDLLALKNLVGCEIQPMAPGIKAFNRAMGYYQHCIMVKKADDKQVILTPHTADYLIDVGFSLDQCFDVKSAAIGPVNEHWSFIVELANRMHTIVRV